MAEETLDAILAEMRAGVCTGPADALDWVSAKLHAYADRIEAAAKRAPGNAAEMRGALVTILDALKDRERDGLTEPRDILERRIVEQALAAPARNCDVGTAEEQAHRFHAFCAGNTSEIEGMCNSTCPCIDCGDKCHCLCVWSQMPYLLVRASGVDVRRSGSAPRGPRRARGRGPGVSARFPIPWRAEGRDNGLRGRQRREWWAVLDRNGFFVAEGLDETTAREIVAAVNARASIRETIAEMDGCVLRFREIFGLRENPTTKGKK